MLLFLLALLLLLTRNASKELSINCSAEVDPLPIPHQFSQPGDLVIGVIANQVFVVQEAPHFNALPSPMLMKEPLTNTKNYQHILALTFAIKEINENLHILLNVTWGFHILNGYLNPKMTNKAVLRFLSTQQRFVPNYKCGILKNPTAIIGGLDSETSVNMATILTNFKMPQFTYGSFSPTQNDGVQFSYLYQMVPREIYQFRGLIRLLQHFNWKWIGLLAMDDDRGDRCLQTMVPLLSENEICYAFILRLPKVAFLTDFSDSVVRQAEESFEIFDEKANVCFVYAERPAQLVIRLLLFLLPLTPLPPLDKVWIFTSPWEFESMPFQRLWEIESYHGSLSFTVHSKEPPRFQNFLQAINPFWAKDDGFIPDFWEHTFECLLNGSTIKDNSKKTCTGEEKLESLPGILFEMGMTGHSYNIYNAVYAVAHALQIVSLSILNHRRLFHGEKEAIWKLKPWQLHQFLKKLTFNNSAGDTMHFNEDGELRAAFDVINWITFPNGSIQRTQVGRLDPWAPSGKELTIQDHKITWHRTYNQVLPLSVCSENCHPGFSRKKKEGKKFCCYDCARCPRGMISEKEDMDSCVKCPQDHYSNRHQNSCHPKEISFLSYQEPLGIFLTTLAIFLSLVTVLVFGTFVKHRDTPIVKANNRSLTYVLFISLLHCFLSSLLFIGQPGKVTCLLRQITFGLIFSVAISSVLAKTVTVLLLFIPTYLSTEGKSMVTVEIFSIVVSGAGLLACIFSPKCYIIVLRPQLNNRAVLMMRGKGR